MYEIRKKTEEVVKVNDIPGQDTFFAETVFIVRYLFYCVSDFPTI